MLLSSVKLSNSGSLIMLPRICKYKNLPGDGSMSHGRLSQRSCNVSYSLLGFIILYMYC